MAIHTYFVKNRDSYFREKLIFEKLDTIGDKLCASEIQSIGDELSKLMDENSDNICDIFRTNKPYFDVFLYSEEECLKFIDNEKNYIIFADIKLLNKIWSLYQNRLIYIS